MANNIFAEFNDRKNAIRAFADAVLKEGWISQERYNELIGKLDSAKLTVGVIGQMEAGRSTFLNAFVFGRPILPAATTPMTAALSLITYGEKEGLEAEFYSKEEWEEQLLQARRDEANLNELEKSRIKAAKELVNQSKAIASQLDSLLGTKKTDSLENLIEHVGAEGNCVSITKPVRIYYPADYLKGVEIVDTPGFNDPIVSREERTKDFPHQADVILMLTYAGRPFDATGRGIIFDNLRERGLGRLVIGINKYDIPFQNGEDENEIRDYSNKACKEVREDEKLVDLVKKAELVPLSAEMALISKLPMAEVSASESYSHSWKRYCDIFELSSQAEIGRKGHFEKLSSVVKDIVLKEKDEIIFTKLQAVLANARAKATSDLEGQIHQREDLIQSLSLSEGELLKKETAIQKSRTKLKKEVENLVYEVDEKLDEKKAKFANRVDDNWKNMRESNYRTIDSFGRTDGVRNLENRLKRNISDFEDWLKKEVEGYQTELKNTVQRESKCFIEDMEKVVKRYLPEDKSSTAILKRIKKELERNGGENISLGLLPEEKKNVTQKFWSDILGR